MTEGARNEWVPARGSGQLGQRSAERLGRSLGKPETFWIAAGASCDAGDPAANVVMAAVEIPTGFRSGRHTHPGVVVANVQEGVLMLDHEGRPTATYKAGDTVFVEAGKIHEDINNGTTPIKLIAAYVVEKGKPLTSPAP